MTLNAVVAIPAVPKLVSGRPSVPKRATSNAKLDPTSASTATTILPSGWIATSVASSQSPLRSLRTTPPVPNVVSGTPATV